MEPATGGDRRCSLSPSGPAQLYHAITAVHGLGHGHDHSAPTCMRGHRRGRAVPWPGCGPWFRVPSVAPWRRSAWHCSRCSTSTPCTWSRCPTTRETQRIVPADRCRRFTSSASLGEMAERLHVFKSPLLDAGPGGPVDCVPGGYHGAGGDRDRVPVARDGVTGGQPYCAGSRFSVWTPLGARVSFFADWSRRSRTPGRSSSGAASAVTAKRRYSTGARLLNWYLPSSPASAVSRRRARVRGVDRPAGEDDAGAGPGFPQRRPLVCHPPLFRWCAPSRSRSRSMCQTASRRRCSGPPGCRSLAAGREAEIVVARLDVDQAETAFRVG